jgi:hypothetical protein
VRPAFQNNRLDAHRGLKTAKHEKQQKDFHRFACHIVTYADRCALWGLIVHIRAQWPGLFLL